MSRIEPRLIVRARFPCLAVLVALGVAALSALAHDTERLQRLITQRYGGEAVARYQAWREVVQQAGSTAEADKLRRVNEFFNRRVRFVEDVQARWSCWARGQAIAKISRSPSTSA
jgi:predicted transglutaminase-like cysteine proteinase